jgi:FkbM family methyltransferase
MPSLAHSPLAPILGQHVPLRGPARLLFHSYARTRCVPGSAVRQVTTRSGDEFEADLSSFLEWQLWAFGGYEAHVGELFRYLVSPGDQCIDVGANVGVHAVRLAKLAGPGGEVIAIEPDADVASRAERNIALNQLGNVQVIQAAATDADGGSVRLYRPGGTDTNRARASVLHHAYLTGPVRAVPMVSIDALRPGPVALIKIDVEGHEAAVVAGAADTIARYSPAIVFEYAPELLRSPAESPFGWLAGQGYQMFRVRNERNGVTGRGRLALDPLSGLPALGGDMLAISPPAAARVAALVR